jgi:hypothetical protein
MAMAPLQDEGDKNVQEAIQKLICHEYDAAYDLLKSAIDQPLSSEYALFAHNLFGTLSFLRGEGIIILLLSV